MNRGKKSLIPVVGGYTIVEVLIFLAVSGAMFFAALGFIGGQQNKAQFLNAVRDFESKLGDIANDVTTGYYTRSVDFSCQEVSGAPSISDALTTDQGANGDCIFIGTVLKFGGDGGNRDKFLQFAMAGLRQTSTGQNVTTLAQATPRPVYGTTGNLQNAVQEFTVGYGATVSCVAFNASSCTAGSPNDAAFGFYTTFGGISPTGQGSSIETDIVPYNNITMNQSIAATAANLAIPNPISITNVLICLESGGTKQYALVKIGGTNSGSSAITTEIKGYTGNNPPCN